MNNKTDIKQEVCACDNDITMENIKLEHDGLEINLQNEGQCLATDLEMNINKDETTSSYDSEIYIKEEPIVSDAELENEYIERIILETKIKENTITDTDFKMYNTLESGKQEFVLDVPSQNGKDSVNKIKKESICLKCGVGRSIIPEKESHSETILPDVSQPNDNEESGCSKEKMAEDVTSESLRLNSDGNRCNCLGSGFREITLIAKIFHKDEGRSEKNVLHNKDNQSMCEICGCKFSLKSALEINQLIHEEKELHKDTVSRQVKPHKCDICDKSYARLRYLKKHKLIHEGIKPHKCNICGMSFTQNHNLKLHKLNHEGKKPHKCNICDMSFTRGYSLKIHKLNHEVKNPYKCNVCDKSLTDPQSLKRHILTHNGQKPHKCTVCDKKFTRLEHLKMHKLVHEGLRPHKCNICDKSFTYLQAMKRHKLTHKVKEGSHI